MHINDIKKLDHEGIIGVFKDNYSGYRIEHQFCPRCGSNNIGETLACFYTNHGIDTNTARCGSCKWIGIVHDLISHPKEANKTKSD